MGCSSRRSSSSHCHRPPRRRVRWKSSPKRLAEATVAEARAAAAMVEVAVETVVAAVEMAAVETVVAA
eukprot:1775354-Prymnesium_polylepis.1